MRPLTARQAEILAFIRSHVQEHALPPTFREMMARFGIRSLNAISDHLQAIERKVYIKLGYGKSRAIQVLEDVATPAARPPGKVAIFWVVPLGRERPQDYPRGFTVLVDGVAITPLMEDLEEAMGVAEEAKQVEEMAFMEEQGARGGVGSMLAAGGAS